MFFYRDKVILNIILFFIYVEIDSDNTPAIIFLSNIPSAKKDIVIIFVTEAYSGFSSNWRGVDLYKTKALILDGNPEYIAHEGTYVILEKKNCLTAFDLIKFIKQVT